VAVGDEPPVPQKYSLWGVKERVNNETTNDTNGLAFKFVEGIGRVGIVAKQSKRC